MTEYIYATDEHEGHWLTDEVIVRCRDCKWCISYWSSVYCNKFNYSLPDSDLDGFCKWGEKRNK